MYEAKTKLGVKTVKLGVYVANHRAVKLYKRCGFKEMYRVRKEKYHFGVMRDRVYMQKHLH
jgi:RimJ/RimL family protein N-acetyltransferase